jgi:hypothetical protein
MYKFLNSRSGEVVPAKLDTAGTAHPLHSLIDPKKEAFRLIGTVKEGGMLIFLGLGGGFAIESALEDQNVHGILIVEYGIHGVAELLASKEYVKILGDPRVRLLVDPELEGLTSQLLGQYLPALFGGITVLPLRSRVELDHERFEAAARTIRSAISAISEDYSVQAYFGSRWFANTLRNLETAELPSRPVPPVRRVAVTAAGPSLDQQIPLLRKQRAEYHLIATDTSLPALLQADIEPDAVISIDCQHISYYHFMEGLPGSVPLFLDLASPPVVASRSRTPHFFSGGNPLTQYISRHWRPFPQVDTSGGNVTYAAISLANTLGAERIDLYGADFSYPGGESYCRGSYIHPFFQRIQHRLNPLESRFAHFVFRNETLQRRGIAHAWRYETKPLAGYRERLELLIPTLNAELHPIPGRGAPIRMLPRTVPAVRAPLQIYAAGPMSMKRKHFLEGYRMRIRNLPPLKESAGAYISRLDADSADVLTTLLPTAAALRRRTPQVSAGETLESVRMYALRELDSIMDARIEP